MPLPCAGTLLPLPADTVTPVWEGIFVTCGLCQSTKSYQTFKAKAHPQGQDQGQGQGPGLQGQGKGLTSLTAAATAAGDAELARGHK